MDQWSGYEVCRDRLMKFLARAQTLEPDRHHRRHPLELGQRPQGELEGRKSPGSRHRVHRHVDLFRRRWCGRAPHHPGLSTARTRT